MKPNQNAPQIIYNKKLISSKLMAKVDITLPPIFLQKKIRRRNRSFVDWLFVLLVEFVWILGDGFGKRVPFFEEDMLGVVGCSGEVMT